MVSPEDDEIIVIASEEEVEKEVPETDSFIHISLSNPENNFFNSKQLPREAIQKDGIEEEKTVSSVLSQGEEKQIEDDESIHLEGEGEGEENEEESHQEEHSE